ncbi:MAG TPA: hypothetical protein VM183_13785 [Burkholderiales bacterium]|nr:hypothetical protein [Burkholderiales bacterium]
MNYQERLRAHLVKYKFRVLGVLAGGAWKGPRTGAVSEQPHILRAEHARLNILAPYRERFWLEFEGTGNGDAQPLVLHRDFAHLNSSQAMCFNLFYPMVVDRGWAATFVQSALGLKDGVKSLAFEYVDDPEENTHFDFFAQMESGAKIYFETRLAELGLGTGELAEGHRDKLARLYAPRLAGLVDEKWLDPEAFFRRYQLMRNLCYLDKPANLLYLVVPRANESLQQALRILPEITDGPLKDRVRVLYLEELLDRLKPLLRGREEGLKAHYREFREKYLPE